jgi:rhodanese-related sulfurtransferase
MSETNSLWIDVREYPEFAAAHIEGTELHPLSTVGSACAAWDKSMPITVVCKSGRRAGIAREQLIRAGFRQVAVLEGGIDRWREQGKPLIEPQSKLWSMERQVRIVAGALVLITLALALAVSRWFLFATAFVGAGLVFAGVTDICTMARVLGAMPWNRKPRNA